MNGSRTLCDGALCNAVLVPGWYWNRTWGTLSCWHFCMLHPQVKRKHTTHASANTCHATTETSCKLEWCPILRKVHPGTIYSHISQRVFPSSILLLLCVLLWMPTWNWLTKKKSSKGTSSNVLEFWRLRSSIYKWHHLQHPSYSHLICMYCGYYPFLLGWITMFADEIT